MRRAVMISLLSGCAQLADLQETSKAPGDAQPADTVRDAVTIDAPLACVGGDTRATDPTTGACYVFFTGPVIRDVARSMCEALGPGTTLATVQTAGEITLIASLIGTSTAFLGGGDEAVEGTFRWEDGTGVMLANWNTGEPNNALGSFEEDCMVVLGGVGGTWDDRPCAPPPVDLGAYGFVCERD
jgi:hypothetical protein